MMKLLKAIGTWLFLGALMFDQAVNWLLGGYPDETLSSRAHRMREKGQPVWGWTADFIDCLFFWQTEHCLQAYRSEVLRSQMPPEFRGSPFAQASLLDAVMASEGAYTARCRP